MKPLLKRTISGTVYAAILIGCVLLSKFTFLALMLFFCASMQYEFMKMTMGKEYKGAQFVGIITGMLTFFLVWLTRSDVHISTEYFLLAVIPIFILMVFSLYAKDKTDFGLFANIYTSLIYFAIPLSITNFLVLDNQGHYFGGLLLCFFGLICGGDIGAYLFGMALGQKYGKKLFPSISPKKSWVGFWGGMFLCLAMSVVFLLTGLWEYVGLKGMTWYHSVLLAAIMYVAAVYGDLFESQWKRICDVKDSGNILPGHGGMMDRLDSAIFAVPVGTIYILIFKLFEISL